MKKIIYALFLISSTLFASAQNSEYVDPNYQLEEEVEAKEDEKPKQKLKPTTRVNLGTSFSSFGKGATMFSNYIAPEVGINLTPKLRVNAGFILEKNYYNGFYMPENNNTTIDGNFTSTWLFTEAEYQLHQKFKISGSILYNVYNDASQFNPYGTQNNAYIMSVRGEWQITNALSVGLEIRQSQGMRNQSYGGFNSGMFMPMYPAAGRYMYR